MKLTPQDVQSLKDNSKWADFTYEDKNLDEDVGGDEDFWKNISINRDFSLRTFYDIWNAYIVDF